MTTEYFNPSTIELYLSKGISRVRKSWGDLGKYLSALYERDCGFRFDIDKK